MTKTISATELANGGAARAIAAAQNEPLLVRAEDGATAWLLNTEALRQAAHERGAAAGYQRALELLAVALYDDDQLTLSQGGALCGMDIHDFIDLCSRMGVAILRGTAEDVAAEMEAARRMSEAIGRRPVG